MTRVLRFVFRNWPLKVAAIVLATLLYAGLVLSQNARTWDGQVPIEVLHQPTNAVLLTTLPSVTNVRFFAPVDTASRLTPDSFQATIDLAGVTVSDTNPFAIVKVELAVSIPGVQVIDWDPQQVRIQLDPLISKTVPVDVPPVTVPDGLQAGPPVLDVQEVKASGPESVIRLVSAAEARVRVQGAVDVDQTVDLVAVDATGRELSPVTFTPRSVRVRMQIASQLSTRTLPVNPIVTGTPAAGYEVGAISVDPPVLAVSGDAGALAPLLLLPTKPVSISGASTSVSQSVALDLPAGVSAVGSSSVTVKVTLRAVTGTRDLTVAIVPDGASSDRTYVLSTTSATVTLGGAVAALGALDGSSFVAKVSVSNLGPGSHQVAVSVALPAGLNLIALNPGTITVTVAPASTPSPGPTPAPSGP